MTDILDPEVSDDAVIRNRRGPGGRLYHGETAIDFFGRRWWGLGLSLVMLLVGGGSLIAQGLNLSLDFEGGVVWTVPSADLTEDQARSVLDDQGIDGSRAKVQILTDLYGSVGLPKAVAAQRAELTYTAYMGHWRVKAMLPLAETGSTNSYIDHLIDTLIPS